MVLYRGCGVIGELRLRIFDIEYRLPWYFGEE